MSTVTEKVAKAKKRMSKRAKLRAAPFKVKPKAKKYKSKTPLGKKIDKSCSQARRPAACAKLGKSRASRKSYM